MIPVEAIEVKSETDVKEWPWRAYRPYLDAPRRRSYEWIASRYGYSL